MCRFLAIVAVLFIASITGAAITDIAVDKQEQASSRHEKMPPTPLHNYLQANPHGLLPDAPR